MCRLKTRANSCLSSPRSKGVSDVSIAATSAIIFVVNKSMCQISFKLLKFSKHIFKRWVPELHVFPVFCGISASIDWQIYEYDACAFDFDINS